MDNGLMIKCMVSEDFIILLAKLHIKVCGEIINFLEMVKFITTHQNK